MKITNAIKTKTRKITTPKPTASQPRTPATAPATAAARAVTPAPATEITSEQIARRAYSIWEQQGRPAGKESEHWLQAEQQLKSSQSFAE